MPASLPRKFSRNSLMRAQRHRQIAKSSSSSSKMNSIDEEKSTRATKTKSPRKDQHRYEQREERSVTLRDREEERRDDVDEGNRDSPSVEFDMYNGQILHAMSSLTEDRFFSETPSATDRDGPPLVVVPSFKEKSKPPSKLPPRPIVSCLKRDTIQEEVSTTTSTTNASSEDPPSISKISTETSEKSLENPDINTEKISRSHSCEFSGEFAVPQQSSKLSRRKVRYPSPARRIGPSSVVSNRSYQTYTPGRGLSSKRFQNNPMSRAMKEELSNQQQMEQKRQIDDLQVDTKRRRRGFFGLILYAVTSFFRLILNILLLPKTVFCYLFQRKRWSANNRAILITGASSGIGAEIARQYAAQGAKIALIARTEEELSRVEQECKDLGGNKVRSYTADLRNLLSIQTAMKLALLDFGHFEVVILNAGRGQGCYFEEIKDVHQIDHLLKLNVTGSIATLHHVLPYMPKSKDSRIVFISNTAGIVATPYQSIYSASKHALTGFSNSLRMELNTTYKKDAPKVCLVNFPEVLGTKMNISRMDMGARLPAARWYSWAGIPLTLAVHDLLPAIASGKREYGQRTWKFQLWRLLYPIVPSWVDRWMLKYVQGTHYRPRLPNAVDRAKADSADMMSVANKSCKSY